MGGGGGGGMCVCVWSGDPLISGLSWRNLFLASLLALTVG